MGWEHSSPNKIQPQNTQEIKKEDSPLWSSWKKVVLYGEKKLKANSHFAGFFPIFLKEWQNNLFRDSDSIITT